jgi:adenylyltransferase/sulfurtransferase
MEFSYLSGRGSRSVVICGRNAVQVTPEARSALSLEDLASRLPGSVAVKSTRFMVRFDVDDLQVAVFPDGRAIITGTRDPAVARGVYARYVGA